MARRVSGIRGLAILIVLLHAFSTDVHAVIERPDARVVIHTWAVSAGIGWQWGYGTLYLADGSQRDFRISGLQFVGFGLAKTEMVGGVYGLERIDYFPGVYSAFEAGAAAIEGISGTFLENDKGVVIRLNGNELGYRLQLGPKNLKIELYE